LLQLGEFERRLVGELGELRRKSSAFWALPSIVVKAILFCSRLLLRSMAADFTLPMAAATASSARLPTEMARPVARDLARLPKALSVLSLFVLREFRDLETLSIAAVAPLDDPVRFMLILRSSATIPPYLGGYVLATSLSMRSISSSICASIQSGAPDTRCTGTPSRWATIRLIFASGHTSSALFLLASQRRYWRAASGPHPAAM
jgi:hypothetical protein